MGKPDDLLIDRIYRACFDKKHPKPALRSALESARRFVLDDAMAGFLADLAYECFFGRHLHIKPHRRIAHIHAGIDSIRHFARLPHKITWVEYSARALSQRQSEFQGQFGGPAGTPDHTNDERHGWLLYQHSKIDTAFSAVISFGSPEMIFVVPHALMWDTGDEPLPWQQLPLPAAMTITASEAVTNFRGYVRTNVGIRPVTEFELPPLTGKPQWEQYLGKVLRGQLQSIWTFLSTVNKIPIVGQHKIKCSRGFMARGQYRRFLDHSIITLHVPEKADTRKLASRVLTELRRMRAHEVRGHFRDDWRLPKGNKSIWVPEHQRGDASLGFVTHDYAVTHPERRTTAQ